MKTYLLSLFLSIGVLFGYANTIYEIKYKFQDETEYTAFLVRYDNNTGFMRVRFYNSKQQYRVVHMEFEEESSKREINGVMHDAMRFVGKNPTYILGGEDGKEAYNPDFIWFAKLPSQKDYKPWGVTSPDAEGKTTSGTITSVKLLNTDELTESYVHSFFGSAEPFYVNLFKKNPTTSQRTATAQTGASIKLIIVANTLDEDIGYMCQLDLDRVKTTFREIASVLNLNFNVIEIKGSNFTKLNTQNAVANVTSSASDIIVFCYTGHGFHYETDVKNPYPQFDFRLSPKQNVDANTMNANEIYAALKTKSAHLKLILTDCCNTFLPKTKLLGKVNASTPRSKVQWSKSNCENLFLRQSGIVMASAASIGEIARCNTEYGGIFLFHFLKSLDKSLSVFGTGQSWAGILSETKSTVLEMSKQTECEEKICTQTTISSVAVK